MAFPRITHISDVLPAIKGRDDFVIAQKPEQGITVLDYVITKPDTFDDIDPLKSQLRRECRGLKFDFTSGKIVARPFHKFFNVGERAATLPAQIPFNTPFVILDKLDGSMIHPVIQKGAPVYMTKMGHTDVAKFAQAFADKNPHYAHLALDCEANDTTPIFEYVAPTNQIVLSYTEPNLILTAIRNRTTGAYVLYENLVALGKHHNLPVVHNLMSQFASLDELLAYVKGIENLEGYVIAFASGARYKLKGEWYVKRHKAKSGLTFEKDIWQMILANEQDDLYPLLPPEEADRLRADAAALLQAVNDCIHTLKSDFAQILTQLRADSNWDGIDTKVAKKLLATVYLTHVDKRIRALYFKAFEGADIGPLFLSFLKDNIKTGPQVENVRPLLNNVKIKPFMFSGEA